MDFDAGSILASLLVSAVGFVLFSYGKKMTRVPHMVTGLVLMVYPYFIPGVIWMLLVGTLLVGLLWGVVRLGY